LADVVVQLDRGGVQACPLLVGEVGQEDPEVVLGVGDDARCGMAQGLWMPAQ
jgi:hypothetical protein